MGPTGVEDQGRMVEKFMTMEERDREEAEKVGNRSHDSYIMFLVTVDVELNGPSGIMLEWPTFRITFHVIFLIRLGWC